MPVLKNKPYYCRCGQIIIENKLMTHIKEIVHIEYKKTEKYIIEPMEIEVNNYFIV